MMTLKQFLCGLHGHTRFLAVVGDTLTLRCGTCQHETPGWSMGAPRFTRTHEGDPARHRLGPPPLVLVRNRSRKMRR